MAEIFQWFTDEQSQLLKNETAQWTHVNEEIADVSIYLTSLITSLGIKIDEAVKKQVNKKCKKIPGAKRMKY